MMLEDLLHFNVATAAWTATEIHHELRELL